jgi:hypothetical protein
MFFKMQWVHSAGAGCRQPPILGSTATRIGVLAPGTTSRKDHLWQPTVSYFVAAAMRAIQPNRSYLARPAAARRETTLAVNGCSPPVWGSDDQTCTSEARKAVAMSRQRELQGGQKC